MHHLAFIVCLQKRMILGYGLGGFVTYICTIWIS